METISPSDFFEERETDITSFDDDLLFFTSSGIVEALEGGYFELTDYSQFEAELQTERAKRYGWDIVTQKLEELTKDVLEILRREAEENPYAHIYVPQKFGLLLHQLYVGLGFSQADFRSRCLVCCSPTLKTERIYSYYCSPRCKHFARQGIWMLLRIISLKNALTPLISYITQPSPKTLEAALVRFRKCVLCGGPRLPMGYLPTPPKMDMLEDFGIANYYEAYPHLARMNRRAQRRMSVVMTDKYVIRRKYSPKQLDIFGRGCCHLCRIGFIWLCLRVKEMKKNKIPVEDIKYRIGELKSKYLEVLRENMHIRLRNPSDAEELFINDIAWRWDFRLLAEFLRSDLWANIDESFPFIRVLKFVHNEDIFSFVWKLTDFAGNPYMDIPELRLFKQVSDEVCQEVFDVALQELRDRWAAAKNDPVATVSLPATFRAQFSVAYGRFKKRMGWVK